MKLDKTLFSRVALLLSIVFLVYTVASTSILDIGPDSLGLPSELPVVFYVGLGLVCCLWYVGFKSKFYLPAALVLTFAYLYVAPMMVRVPVWISNSYYPYGESLLINANGHITYNPAASMVSYHFWPLYLYFASGFTLITGMSTEAVLKFFPVFTVAVYGLLTVLILRVKLAFRYACAGSAVVMASLFIRQQYFGPQAIAYIFFLAIVLIVTLLFFEKTTKPRTLASLLFPLLVLTTFLHPLTSFGSVVLCTSWP